MMRWRLSLMLCNNRSLRSSDLSENRRVTGATWQRFFWTVLANNPSSGLTKLDLGSCNQLDNVVIRALENALVNNSKLKVLSFSGNTDYWHRLRNFCCRFGQNTALEELELENEMMNDWAMFFDHSQDWEPPLSVLCNAASIMGTYNSNHFPRK